MPWLPFTHEDVRSRLAVREIEVYEDTADANEDGTPSFGDRMQNVVAQTIGLFRGKIRANPGVSSLGPEGYLPDFCIFPASVIARVALIGMNPVAEGMTDPRRDEYRDAMKELTGLATLNPSAFASVDPSGDSSSAGASYGGKPLLDF